MTVTDLSFHRTDVTRPGAVAAVVISHGPSEDLSDCLAALAPQVDELVLVMNIPAPMPVLPAGTTVIHNARPVGFSENVNIGTAATAAPFVISVNPDAIADPGSVATLVDFARSHPGAGIVGPQMRYANGTWQPSRRMFPTVLPSLVRRSPLRRIAPERLQRSHYLAENRPTEPVLSDWMLGGFLLFRRTMLDELGGFDEGYRLYVEDIDIAYRAALAGWDRWYVPEATVMHRYAARIDKRFLTRHNWWHLKSMVRFCRKFPETLSRGITPASAGDAETGCTPVVPRLAAPVAA